jgi:hypothetical protein
VSTRFVRRFAAHVDRQGRLRLEDRPAFDRELRHLANGPVELTVARPRRRRSNDQNAWWWGVAVPLLADHCGYDRVSMHYALVTACFGSRFDARLGVDIPNARSSKLTTREFSELMEWVVTFAATELNLTVPLPEDVSADQGIGSREANDAIPGRSQP